MQHLAVEVFVFFSSPARCSPIHVQVSRGGPGRHMRRCVWSQLVGLL